MRTKARMGIDAELSFSLNISLLARSGIGHMDNAGCKQLVQQFYLSYFFVKQSVSVSGGIYPYTLLQR